MLAFFVSSSLKSLISFLRKISVTKTVMAPLVSSPTKIPQRGTKHYRNKKSKAKRKPIKSQESLLELATQVHSNDKTATK